MIFFFFLYHPTLSSQYWAIHCFTSSSCVNLCECVQTLELIAYPWGSPVSWYVRSLHWISVDCRGTSHAKSHASEFSLSQEALAMYSEIYPLGNLCPDGQPHRIHRISQGWFGLKIVSLLGSSVDQGFSILVLLTFGAWELFVLWNTLLIEGC